MTDKKLYIPYLPPAASSATEHTPAMDMLRLYTSEDMKACPLDKWGILDPGTERRDVAGKREDGQSVLILLSHAARWTVC